jgi:outer membrane protein
MRIKVHKMITKKVVLLFLFIGLQMAAQGKKWTLEECVDYAIKKNISIKQSALDVNISSIEKLEALGGFLPTFNANANYSVNTGASINPVTNQFQNQTFESFSAGAS